MPVGQSSAHLLKLDDLDRINDEAYAAALSYLNETRMLVKDTLGAEKLVVSNWAVSSLSTPATPVSGWSFSVCIFSN